MRRPRACARRPDRITSRNCTGSAPNCRCRRGWCRSTMRCSRRWPMPPRTESTHRQGEPYRQALTGVVRARRRALHRAHRRASGARGASRRCRAYATPQELMADLQIAVRIAASQRSGVLAETRLDPLIRAIEVFGFHLAPIDMRQNSDVHEETVAELLRWPASCADYRALDEDGGCALLVAELRIARLLATPFADVLASATKSELGDLREAARCARDSAPPRSRTRSSRRRRASPTCSRSRCC